MTEDTTTTEQAPAAEETPTTEAVEQAAPQQEFVPPPRAAEALQMLMEREKSVRDTEASIKSQQTEVERARKLLDMAKANPLQFLNDVGTSYEDVTQQVLQGNRPDPTATLQKELQDIRTQLQVRQDREHQASRKAALDEVRSLVTDYINTSDQYPLTKQAGMQDMVFQHIQDHFNKTGQALSEASAAKEVEEYLSSVVDKLAQVDSVRNRFIPQEPATEEPDVTQLANTLTNRQASSTPTRTDGEKPLSYSDSIRRAASMLEFVNNT